MTLPIKPVPCQGGYFVMGDITGCRDLIPEKYLTTHEYEAEDDPAPVLKNHLYMPTGTIPLDLAFCRWMAIEKGVCMVPVSVFYEATSPTIMDSYVRLAICKDRESLENTIERLRNAI